MVGGIKKQGLIARAVFLISSLKSPTQVNFAQFGRAISNQYKSAMH